MGSINHKGSSETAENWALLTPIDGEAIASTLSLSAPVFSTRHLIIARLSEFPNKFLGALFDRLLTRLIRERFASA